MATTKTKSDLIKRILAITGKDRANPDTDFYNDLLNEAIGIISDIMGPVESSWTNAANGGLTLSGYTFALPTDCIEPQSVEWDGVPIDKLDRAQFDVLDSQWRDATGTPGAWFSDGVNAYLDCSPSGTATGMLTLRGKGYLPEFPANDATTPNPLTYFPAGFNLQFLPADYAIANLPVEPVQPTSDKPESIRWAEMQTKLRMDTRERHEKKWAEGLVQLADAFGKRQMDIFRF